MAHNRTSFSIHNILNRGHDCETNAGHVEEYAEEQEAQDCSSLPVENAGAESISSCVLVLDSSSSDQHSCEEGSTEGEDTSLETRHGEALRQLLRRCIETGQCCKTLYYHRFLHVCQTWLKYSNICLPQMNTV